MKDFSIPAISSRLKDDITSYMRDQSIAIYKLPERLEVIQSIPRNPVGKVLKRELREKIKEIT